MTTKIGRLGRPRIAISLVWMIPADSRECSESDTPHDPIPPEDVEFMRALTGLDPDRLVERLEDIAERIQSDPEGMRRELVRLADGDELAAAEVIRLIRGVGPGNDSGHDDDEATGDVVDLERPDEEGDSP